MSETQVDLFSRARRFLERDLWRTDLRPRSVAAVGVRMLQLGVMIGEGFVRDQLLLRASALTYIAALSLIPALVVVFSVVKGLGFGDDLLIWAVDLLAVGTPQVKEFILERLAVTKLGALGGFGAATVAVMTVLALRHAESTLNEIWGVRRSRTWMRRLADYLLVLVIVPLFMSAALSLDATLQSAAIVNQLLEIPLFDLVYRFGLRFMPLVLLFAGFTFVYWFLPNTTVRVRSALLGGVVAATLFVIGQRLFLDFIADAAKYDAFFGSFAAVPLILFWLYLSFSIALFGAEVSFAHQNLAQYRREIQGEFLGIAGREAVGLRIVVEIGRAFRDRGNPPGADELSEVLDVPVRTVRDLLDRLHSKGIVAELAADERETGYHLGAPAEKIRITDVLVALRGVREVDSTETPTEQAVDVLLSELEAGVAAISDAKTVADVLRDVPPLGDSGRKVT